MSNQTSLFTEDAPVLPAHTLPPANALAISALKPGTAQATPAQKRFTQLVSQTETLVRKIESTRQLTDAHRRFYAQSIPPLENERNGYMRQMALWLAQRLQTKGLTPKQKELAREMPEVDHFLGSADMLGLERVLGGDAARMGVSELDVPEFVPRG